MGWCFAVPERVCSLRCRSMSYLDSSLSLRTRSPAARTCRPVCRPYTRIPDTQEVWFGTSPCRKRSASRPRCTPSAGRTIPRTPRCWCRAPPSRTAACPCRSAGPGSRTSPSRYGQCLSWTPRSACRFAAKQMSFVSVWPKVPVGRLLSLPDLTNREARRHWGKMHC